jgi:hypothetical protein
MEHPLKQYSEVQQYIETMSAPYLAAQVSDDNQCTEVGKLLIQSLLLLHGGGLVAVAAFAAQKQVPAAGSGVVILLSVGLLVTLVGGYSAFLALSRRSCANGARVKEVRQRAWAQFLELEHTRTENPALKDEAARATTEADRIANTVQPNLDAYERYHRETIDLLLLSAFCLVVAAYVAAFALR